MRKSELREALITIVGGGGLVVLVVGLSLVFAGFCVSYGWSWGNYAAMRVLVERMNAYNAGHSH